MGDVTRASFSRYLYPQAGARFVQFTVKSAVVISKMFFLLTDKRGILDFTDEQLQDIPKIVLLHEFEN